MRLLKSLILAVAIFLPCLVTATPILYGIDFTTQNLITIDVSNANTTTIGSAAPLRNGLAFDAGGTLYSNDRGIFGTIDPLTASATVINGATGRDLLAMDFNNDFSTLYGIEFLSSGDIYSIDPLTGNTSFVVSTGIRASGLAIDAANNVFIADTFGGDIFQVDIVTGALTFLVSIGEGITAMTIDDAGLLYAVGISSDDLYSIDSVSGAATNIGHLPFSDVRGLAFTSVEVPEPGTLALLGIGLAGMGLARRRRKV